MTNNTGARDVYLQPGDFHFGERNTRIRTVLGSCVSIVMWHEKYLIGGMCHYLLPKHSGQPNKAPDGRYAEDAIELFMKKIRDAKTKAEDYQVKIFGGGNMFSKYHKPEKCKDVPCQNIIAARELVKRYGLNLVSENVGGYGHRQIRFEIWNGHVWVRRIDIDAKITAGNLHE
jgi:chemotaxis protein CheD